MEKNSEELDKIINLLRKFTPVPGSINEIERRVIQEISGMGKTKISFPDIIDFLFGWVYIGWVRRSLITASFLLVLFFIWQQGIILKQINYLSSQPVIDGGEVRSDQTGFSENKLMLFKLYGRKLPSQNVTISKKQMDMLLESVNDLQTKYKDLMDLIEKDPELKRYIENKLIELNQTKIKL